MSRCVKRSLSEAEEDNERFAEASLSLWTVRGEKEERIRWRSAVLLIITKWQAVREEMGRVKGRCC